MSRYAASLALNCLIATAFATPALAETAPTVSPTYQKRVLSVVAQPGDPFSAQLNRLFTSESRFVVLPSAGTPAQSPTVIVAEVAAAARKAGYADASVFAFVPRYHFGHVGMSVPQAEHDSDGRIRREGRDETITVSAEITCPFEYTADLYAVPTGRLVRTFHFTDALSRKLQYTYNKHDSATTVTIRAVELGASLGIEIGRPPAAAFATQADRAMGTFANLMRAEMRTMPEFQLQAGVTGWATERDRVFFNLGSGLDVRPDDWFKVVQDGRSIGFLKVRSLTDAASEGQPIFLDTNLRVGDRIVEYPKANMWHGLKAGAVALTTGPLFSVGYGFQWDVAPAFNGSETYFTTDLDVLTDGKAPGFQGQIGVIKKLFFRRWGFSLGGKVGVFGLPAITREALVPVGTLATGVDCYLTPDLVWTNDLGFEALWPIATTASPNTFTVPFGPTLRTGITFVF